MDCTWEDAVIIKAKDIDACCDIFDPKTLQQLLSELDSEEIKLKLNFKYDCVTMCAGLKEEGLDDNINNLNELMQYCRPTQLKVPIAQLADCYLPRLKLLFKKPRLTRCFELLNILDISDEDGNDALCFYPVVDYQPLMSIP